MSDLYGSISELLEAELSVEEDVDTQALIDKLKPVEKRGYLTKEDFLEIGMWKSARPKNWYLKNSDKEIHDTTKQVFDTQFEKRRIDLLTGLAGVSIPTASAILTLTNPERYGVIDIRVWEVLYEYRSVTVNPTGTNFSFKNWYNYLAKLRYFAEKYQVKARDIERTLFDYHRRRQTGPLY